MLQKLFTCTFIVFPLFLCSDNYSDDISSISASGSEVSDNEDMAPQSRHTIASAAELTYEDESDSSSLGPRNNKVMLEVGGLVYSMYRALVQPSKVGASYTTEYQRRYVWRKKLVRESL